MNLIKLFDAQKELDAKIVREKGLEGRDLLPQKILALQVELGELANEWRGFKFWSKDQQARTCACNPGPGNTGTYNPLLEEYVDCLHFILLIGLKIKAEDWLDTGYSYHQEDITKQFNRLFAKVGDFSGVPTKGNYEAIVDHFQGLGEMLGFTWEQIESAYFANNQINHERQANGY